MVKIVVVGGIASNYQGKRVKKICSELSLKFRAPLWSYTAKQLWKELLKKKFKVILTKIACEGIPKKFVGRIIGKKEIEELKNLSEKYKFRLDFEGGEAETSVLYMPGMKREINLTYNIKSEGKHRHFLKLKKLK
jgi:uncharacterized protein (TIGR00290 family)